MSVCVCGFFLKFISSRIQKRMNRGGGAARELQTRGLTGRTGGSDVQACRDVAC